MTSGSTTAFVESGVYQRLECGCVMFAIEIDPCGPCLCLVENAGTCERDHTTDDFMPIRFSRKQALALAGYEAQE